MSTSLEAELYELASAVGADIKALYELGAANTGATNSNTAAIGDISTALDMINGESV